MDGKVCPVVGAKPGNPYVQGSSYLVLKYGYEPSHLWRNFGIIIAIMIIFCIIHLLAAEYVPAERSKGEFLLFQRRHIMKQPQRLHELEKDVASPLFAQDLMRPTDRDAFVQSPKAIKTIVQQSSIFHWQNLSYEIKASSETKKVLKSIDGWVKPGTFTALMVIII
jgi:ATP-binding cassette, subfamily G (WHITE), member 2, PDR